MRRPNYEGLLTIDWLLFNSDKPESHAMESVEEKGGDSTVLSKSGWAGWRDYFSSWPLMKSRPSQGEAILKARSGGIPE